MTRRPSASDKYIAIHTDDDDDETDTTFRTRRPSAKPSILPWVLAAVCVVCTITDIILFLLSRGERSVPRPHPLSSGVTLGELRRPSQYIRLDEVVRPSPPDPVQFDIFPIVVAAIDRERRDKVFDNEPRGYMSSSGYISSEERRILVTSSVSTIIQFRAIDYGMEICELHADLPQLVPNMTSVAGHKAMLSLFRLNASVPMNTKAISYNNRPERLFKIDDVPLSPDGIIRWHHRIACASEELLTFEIARPEFDSDYVYHVEWWQNREGNTAGPGVFITQHSTV